ncbi:MAG: ABC transporter ATP-binding protein [Bifidobacteriaceae bacterium]|jgi:putative ABC transport system ATP-binding protein|nr:ABC transporter ATP-binding protein [Bifidobacteriaceae bacterium]
MSGITQQFPPNTTALENVSLSLDHGQSLAIVGPSGSGKSTLLAILGLLEKPDGGDYILDGRALGKLSATDLAQIRKNDIGYVFQSFNLIDYLSVEENILYALTIKGIRGSQARDRMHRALENVGLLHRRNASPSTLSGGEQQRTAIARAIVTAPKLLLCDEPTGNLDSANSNIILHLILDSVAANNAVIIVTHDEHIAAACTRRVVLRDGHLRETPGGGTL